VTTRNNGPVLIEIDEGAIPVNPSAAPVVPESDVKPPQGQAMQTLALLAGKRPSRLWRVFRAAIVAFVGLLVAVWAWDFFFSLLGRNIWLGRGAMVVAGVLIASALGLALREWVSFVRLGRIEKLRAKVAEAASRDDLALTRQVLADITRFYRGRDDLSWAIENLNQLQDDVLDADGLLQAGEREVMAPLDAAARREIEVSARQVATITAIVPLALFDVLGVLGANLRMVRRIAEIYGGRTGSFGSWRLLRAVLLHLVATGAVAVGDDLIGSLAGGGLVSKVSRRFGEGVVNGALTARVGIAALEVCRPMPFAALDRPKVTGLVKNALTGVFAGR